MHHLCCAKCMLYTKKKKKCIYSKIKTDSRQFYQLCTHECCMIMLYHNFYCAPSKDTREKKLTFLIIHQVQISKYALFQLIASTTLLNL